MSLRRINSEGRVEVETASTREEVVAKEYVKEAVSGAGLSLLKEELSIIPGVVSLAANEEIMKASKRTQAILFLKAAGYSTVRIGEAVGLKPSRVFGIIQEYDPKGEVKFSSRNRREFQSFKIHRLQTRILDSVSEEDILEADLRDKVGAVVQLQEVGNVLMDKVDSGKEEDSVDLHKSLMEALQVKVVAKQIPEKANSNDAG